MKLVNDFTEYQILDLNNDNVQMYLNGEKVDEIKLKDEGEFEVKVEF